jgi:hypothetical protein
MTIGMYTLGVRVGETASVHKYAFVSFVLVLPSKKPFSDKNAIRLPLLLMAGW